MPHIKTRSGLELFYELDDFTDPWKDAPVLVLQHGWGRVSTLWYSWIPYLSRYYRIVRPDLRGLGYSNGGAFDVSKDLTIDGYLEDFDALLNHLEIEDAHFCGESMGGMLELAYAATRPERVRTVSILGSPVFLNKFTVDTFSFGYPTWQEALRDLGTEGHARKVNSATRFPDDVDPGLFEFYAVQMGRNDVEVVVAMSELAKTVDLRPVLPDIQAPVLGLYPSAGRITNSEQEDALKNGISNLNLVHLPIPYHAIQVLEPSLCAEAVLHFASQFDGVPCHE